MHLTKYQLKRICNLIFFITVFLFSHINFVFADIESSVKDWAETWSSEEVELYLQSYANEFTPFRHHTLTD